MFNKNNLNFGNENIKIVKNNKQKKVIKPYLYIFNLKKYANIGINDNKKAVVNVSISSDINKKQTNIAKIKTKLVKRLMLLFLFLNKKFIINKKNKNITKIEVDIPPYKGLPYKNIQLIKCIIAMNETIINVLRVD